MGQIFTGLLMFVGGVAIIFKTEWLISNFGRLEWFDQKLHSEGGSRLGYKLIGIILVFIGIIFATGSGSIFLEWLLSPLIRAGG